MVSFIFTVAFEENSRTESSRKDIGRGVHQTWIPFIWYIILPKLFDPQFHDL